MHCWRLLICVYPSNPFAILPLPICWYIIYCKICPNSMLFTIFPASYISTSIRPNKFALTVFFIFQILPNIYPSIFPCKLSFSVHFILDPVALVYSTIIPAIFAKSLSAIIYKVSLIIRSILSFKYTLAIL